MGFLWFFVVLILYYSVIQLPKKKVPTTDKKKSDDDFFKNSLKYGQFEDIKLFYELHKINGYTRFLKNVRMPMEDKSIRVVDLMMISQKGIFLFDGKDLMSSIYGDESNKYWTYITTKEERKKITNPIWSMKSYLNVLKRILGVYEPTVYRIIVVFDYHSNIQKMNITTPLIQVVHQKELVLRIREEMFRTQNIFTPQQVDKIHEKLKKYADFIIPPKKEVQQDETTSRNGLVLIKGKKK